MRTLTLDTLPSSGVIRVYLTADVITPESAEFGDADRRGWVDDRNPATVEEARNYVRPIFECTVADFLHDEDMREVLRERIQEWTPLPWAQTDDGSTLYAADTVTRDYATGEEWSYAIHAHVKHYALDGRGYVEDDLDIVTGL